MIDPVTDPRVFFAAERTLLAWIRTGITVLALGFVVARFGLFITMFAQQSPDEMLPSGPSMLANIIGIMLVITGTVTLFMAALQHRTFLKSLRAEEIPPQYRPQVALFLSFTLAMVGVLVIVYLSLSASA